jgi:aspartate oxidase
VNSQAQTLRHAGRVAIVGGGIAGAWLAYRLAQRDVPTVLIATEEHAPATSRQWAFGLVDRRVLGCATAPAADVFADGSRTQDPAYAPMMAEYFAEEFDELSRLVEYAPFGEEYVHPRLPEPGIHMGGGGSVVDAVLARFEELGGTRIHGRVTDLVVDGDLCLGVRYEHKGVPGRILCAELVFASGGFCGLFEDGVGGNTGYLLGTYARHGGRLASLELFNRFALGLPDRKRPLYPSDFDGRPRLLRAGERAAELERALEAYRGDRCDVDVFAHYWTRNLDVPHTVELADGAFRLGPVRGFSMGGMATSRSATALRNVHATGECAYGLAVDSISGKPFPSFLAMGRMLADALTKRSTGVPDTDFDAGGARPGADASLRKEIRHRLDAFQDSRFSMTSAEEFARWCRRERGRRRADGTYDNEDVDLLILAEACTRSAMARRESRGFFFRPDLPTADHSLDNQVTLARYDAADDQVHVTLSPRESGASA